MWHFPYAPEQASDYAVQHDYLFYTISALTVLFSLIIVALVTVFSIRYRRGNKVDRTNAIDSHTMLELTWSGIPAILGLVMFFWAAKLFVDLKVPPKDAMDIYVIGKQWMWHSQHENGIRENNRLTVPVGKPIRLIMISQDVLHSFFLPQFRIKQDVLPGRYTMQWFTASKTGVFNIFCAEYCGTQHSEMGGYIEVLTPEAWQRWAETGGEKVAKRIQLPAERGKDLWDNLNCASCHSETDTEQGPSLYGIYGTQRKMNDGSVVTVNREYIRESILYPYRKMTAGYSDPTMAEYAGTLTEEQVLDLYEYVKTLGGKAPGAATASDTAVTR